MAAVAPGADLEQVAARGIRNRPIHFWTYVQFFLHFTEWGIDPRVSRTYSDSRNIEGVSHDQRNRTYLGPCGRLQRQSLHPLHVQSHPT